MIYKLYKKEFVELQNKNQIWIIKVNESPINYVTQIGEATNKPKTKKTTFQRITYQKQLKCATFEVVYSSYAQLLEVIPSCYGDNGKL